MIVTYFWVYEVPVLYINQHSSKQFEVTIILKYLLYNKLQQTSSQAGLIKPAPELCLQIFKSAPLRDC